MRPHRRTASRWWRPKRDVRLGSRFLPLARSGWHCGHRFCNAWLASIRRRPSCAAGTARVSASSNTNGIVRSRLILVREIRSSLCFRIVAQRTIIAEFALFSISFAREFFDEGAGRGLQAILLVPQDPEAAVAKRLRLGGVSLGHNASMLSVNKSVCATARPKWFPLPHSHG